MTEFGRQPTVRLSLLFCWTWRGRQRGVDYLALHREQMLSNLRYLSCVARRVLWVSILQREAILYWTESSSAAISDHLTALQHLHCGQQMLSNLERCGEIDSKNDLRARVSCH